MFDGTAGNLNGSCFGVTNGSLVSSAGFSCISFGFGGTIKLVFVHGSLLSTVIVSFKLNRFVGVEFLPIASIERRFDERRSLELTLCVTFKADNESFVANVPFSWKFGDVTNCPFGFGKSMV